MPSDLGVQFLDHCAQSEKTKHHSIKFSGLYCIGSPESEFWRTTYGKLPHGVKIGKSIDVIRRMNEYLLYYPWASPQGTKIHCLLCLPHAVTKDAKANVDAAERWVLSTLKERYPSHDHWPGIAEKYRLYFSRSEWLQGVRLSVVENLFKVAQQKFGGLYILNDGKTDVPATWYAWRQKHQQGVKDAAALRKRKREDDDKVQEEQARKRAIHEDIYGPKKYKPRVRL